MRAFNRKKKPKHTTKVKLVTFDGESYFPTWLWTKKQVWTSNVNFCTRMEDGIRYRKDRCRMYNVRERGDNYEIINRG